MGAGKGGLARARGQGREGLVRGGRPGQGGCWYE